MCIIYIHVRIYMYIIMLMRDSEGSEEEKTSKVKHTTKQNTPKAVTFPKKMSYLGWDLNPSHFTL